MTTKIQSHGTGANVVAAPTATRRTAAPATPFKNVMNASAAAVVNGANHAVRRLPGGPILAAAMTPGAVAAPGGVSTSSLPAGTTPGSGVTAGAASGQPGAAGGTPIESVLSENANQNLYFLQLQEQISAESRAYSAASNILKARHDTVKNAIGNIR
jgi:hypothetical protein